MKSLNLLLSGLLTAFLFYAFLLNIDATTAKVVGLVFVAMTLGLIQMAPGMVGANYVPSAIAKAQAKLLSKFANNELRAVDPVTFKAFLKNSEIMFPTAKTLRTREDRTLEAYYKLRTYRALGTGRTHAPSGAQGDSGVLTPSYTTYNDVFKTSLKLADNNVFSLEELVANEAENLVKNFSEGNETVATDHIFNNRSGVNVAVAEGTFNAVTTTFEITGSTNGTRSIQITRSAMDENKYNGATLTVFCDTVAFNKFHYLANQGTSNAVNTQFQFEKLTFIKSLYLTAKAATLGYTGGFWIAAPDDTFGVLDWIPKQNRAGVNMAPYEYSSFLNPIDGLNYAVFKTYAAGNTTASGGYTQDITTQYEFSVDLAFEHAPLSVANETTFQAFAIV